MTTLLETFGRALAPTVGGAVGSFLGPIGGALGTHLGGYASMYPFERKKQPVMPVPSVNPQAQANIPAPVQPGPAPAEPQQQAASTSRTKTYAPAAAQTRSPYDSVQNLMIQQQQDRVRERRISQQEGQRQNVQSARQNQQMGQHLDRAFAQMQGNFQQGAAAMQQYMNDPMMRQLLDISMRRARGGAIDANTVGQMKGAASAQNSANVNASLRTARDRLAGSGVSGVAKETLLAALRNDGAARGERTSAGIDVDVAQFNAGQRGQALSQALGVAGARAGIAQDYARYMNSFNPLSAIGQMAALQAPAQQIGYNVGRIG